MIKFLGVLGCISSRISTYKAIVWTPENKSSMRGFFCWPSSRVSSRGDVEVQVYPRENFFRDAWPRSLPSKVPDSWSKEGPTESHSLRAAGRRWPLASPVQLLLRSGLLPSPDQASRGFVESSLKTSENEDLAASLDDLFWCCTTSRGNVTVLVFSNVIS